MLPRGVNAGYHPMNVGTPSATATAIPVVDVVTHADVAAVAASAAAAVTASIGARSGSFNSSLDRSGLNQQRLSFNSHRERKDGYN